MQVGPRGYRGRQKAPPLELQEEKLPCSWLLGFSPVKLLQTLDRIVK